MIDRLKQRAIKNTATIVEKLVISPDLISITFEATDRSITWKPGQVLGVMVNPSGKGMKDRWRHYTIRSSDRDRFSLLAVAHGNSGIGETWAANAASGDTFTFMGPAGGAKKFDADRDLVFLGDHTGLGTLNAYASALSSERQARAFVLTPNTDIAEAVLDIPAAITWVQRGTGTEFLGATLERAESMLGQAAEPGWLTSTFVLCGEKKLVGALRSELRGMGVSRDSLHTQAHWTPGVKGM